MVSIDPSDLDIELIRHSAEVAQVHDHYANCSEAHATEKVNAARVEAQRFLELREEAEENGEKVTVDAMKARVAADSKVNAAKLAEVETEADKIRARGLVAAIEAKGSNLIQLSSNRRRELRAPTASRLNDGDE
jgi:hypothetical protein